MIDLDVSERACDDLIGHGLGYLPPAGIGNSVSIKELIASLRQAEKDAARYRWLRDSEISAVGGVAIEMDKKIDEAMQCGGEENDHASEESRVDLEGLMFNLGNYKAMLGRAENVLFEAERVLVEYQKNGGIEFDDLIGEIAYYVKYMSKGECSDS